MTTRVVQLSGPFTEADLARIAKVLREIERDRPDDTFFMTMADDTTLDEAARLVFNIFPPRADP